MSAQLKLIIDKCYCRGLQLKNKKVGTIVVGGSPVDSIQYELIDKQFDCMAKYLSFETVVGETYDRFSMQYSFKTADDSGRDTSRNFLFNDLQFHSVFAGDNSFVQITSDHKAKQNWLKFSKKRPTDEDSGVLGLLASVKGCVSFFQNGCRSLSYVNAPYPVPFLSFEKLR